MKVAKKVHKVLLISMSLISLYSVNLSANTCIDSDGDGWGWDGTTSCIPDGVTSSSAPAQTNNSANINTQNSSSDGAPCIDSDGDGFGWDGVMSCIPDGSTSSPAPTQANNSSNVNTQNNSSGGAPCIDSDGDGFGWNGVMSCVPDGATNSPAPVQTVNTNTQNNSSGNAPCIDSDGDGFGWDGVMSCIPDATSNSSSNPINNTNTASNNNSNGTTVAPKNNFQSSQCASINNGDMLSQVTDVILTAGQSNAAGNQTFYQQNLDVDKQHNQILAWTMPINGSPQWQIADPSTQTWHGFFPRHPNYRNIPNSRAFNHPAFQIAKNIVRKDPCRVVALIATAAPGMPISHWLGDNNDSHFKSITNTVRQALSHIQHKSNVDMIWWMQGESDNNPNHNAYFGQLQNLINKFRAQNWYDSSRYFLANETGWFVDANAGIRLAGQDNDANTDFSPSPLKFQSSFSNAQLRYLTGYNVAEPHFLRLDITSETAEDGSPANVHYNEIAFRMIGDRVANKYLFEYGGAR